MQKNTFHKLIEAHLSLENDINEISINDVNLPKDYVHDHLNEKIWNGYELRPEIQEKLEQIAKDFYEFLKVDAPIEDIWLTGSLANYNWTEFSDVDLHILLDYGLVDEDEEFVLDFFNNKKKIWNDSHDINMRGFSVELYAQDSDAPHKSTGVYSIKDEKWVRTPSLKKPEVDKELVKTKVKDIVDQIEDIENLEDLEKTQTKGKKLKEKIKKMRKSGLALKGEFSAENIAFKYLRNNGFLGRLFDTIRSSYDKSMSVNEEERTATATYDEKENVVMSDEVLNIINNDPNSIESINENDLHRFPFYKLKEIPVSSLNVDSVATDEATINKQIEGIRSNPDYSPIVYDPERKVIINGAYKIKALEKLGHDTIRVYVGTKESVSMNENFAGTTAPEIPDPKSGGYCVMTQELSDRLKGPRRIRDGYCFYFKNPEELEALRQKYPEGSTYNNEVITVTGTYSENDMALPESYDRTNIRNVVRETINEFFTAKGFHSSIDDWLKKWGKKGVDINLDLYGDGMGIETAERNTLLSEDEVFSNDIETAGQSEYDYREVAIGTEVEMEHTNDREEAKRIAIEHLENNGTYYSDAIGCGLIDEPEALELYDQYFGSELHEGFKSKAQQRYFYAMADKPGKEGKKFEKWAKEFSDDTDFEEIPEKVNEEEDKDSKKDHKLFLEKNITDDLNDHVDSLKDFIIACCEEGEISEPTIIYLRGTRDHKLTTTASYTPGDHDVHVYSKGRHIIDIMRSIAHELMHMKQDLEDRLYENSGEDGSPEENEAHSFSGLMIRKFGRENPKLYEGYNNDLPLLK